MRNPLIHHQKSARPHVRCGSLEGDVLGLRTVLLKVTAAAVRVRDDHGVHAASIVIIHGMLIRRRRVLFDGRRRWGRKAVGGAPLGRHRGVEVQLGKVQGLLGNDLHVGELVQVLVGRGGGTGRKRWQRRRRGETGLQVRGRSHRKWRLGNQVGRGRHLSVDVLHGIGGGGRGGGVRHERDRRISGTVKSRAALRD